jgi:hypothetical protein
VILAGLGVPLVADHAMPFLAAMLSSACTAFLITAWMQPVKPAPAQTARLAPLQMTAPPQALPVAAPIGLEEALNRMLGEDGQRIAVDDQSSSDPRALVSDTDR